MTYYITAINRQGEIMGNTQTDALEIHQSAIKYYLEQGWFIKIQTEEN